MENRPNYYAIIPANVRYNKNLSPNAKLLYGEITALCNAEGFCWATNAYFMELYDVTKRSVQSWLSQLENEGFISVVLTNQGSNDSIRKIYIVSPHEEKFTTPRKKMHGGHEEKCTTPHEEKCTHNNTSINTTNNNTKNKTNKSISPQLEQEFETLWQLYPRKIGKKKAFDAFKKARKIKKVSYESIKNGLYKYLEYINLRQIEEQFIMHGSTWFNQEKWQDEYIATGIQKKPKNALEYFRAKYKQGEGSYEPYGNGEIIDAYSEFLPKPL